jgi:hypothetical protein
MMSALLQVLNDARSILVIDWPSPDVPDTLAASGRAVVVKGGPGLHDFSERCVGPDGAIVVQAIERPEHVDLVYCHRPIDELPGIVALARELGAATLGYQSGLAEHGVGDPTGCWLSDQSARQVRSLVEAAGLGYVDDVYIADAARALGPSNPEEGASEA